FVDADTYAAGGHENFEGLLDAWGVNFMHKTASDGVEQSYLIRDMANSLTVDGYTVLAKSADIGLGTEIFGNSEHPIAFANSTCISFARDFIDEGNGIFSNSENGIKKTVAPLMTSHASAEAWMGGRAVERADAQPFTLISLSQSEDAEGRGGYLVACASTEFASSEVLGSSVLGNGRAMAQMIKYMGKDNAPTELVFKTFTGNRIESLTTSAANACATVLAIVPTLTVVICGAVVMIRRKFL
ncbi:MAG: hypothetical protein IJC64_00195, partial [Clostridia bacterium]|nr:hypothetical protein [Clostridia bacterium]